MRRPKLKRGRGTRTRVVPTLRWGCQLPLNSPACVACRQHRRCQRSRKFLLLSSTETGIESAKNYIEPALKDFSVSKADILQKNRVDCSATKLSTISAVWAAQYFPAVKFYLTVNGSFRLSVTGWKMQRIEVILTMSGQGVTRLRTPALALLAIQCAARPNSKKITLFGAGFQGRSPPELLLELSLASDLCAPDFRDVSDWYFDTSNRYNCRVPQQTPEFAVNNADVIIVSMRSKSPLFAESGARHGDNDHCHEQHYPTKHN